MALEYLNHYAKSGKAEKPNFWDDEYINLSSIAYISSVLSEGGYDSIEVRAIIDRLYPQINNIPFTGRFN